MAVSPLVVDNINILATEFKYPTEISKKRKWYVTIKCERCKKIVTKTYQKSEWNMYCNSCSHCKRTTKSFIEDATNIHGATYDYSESVYSTSKNKVKIICKKHGAFYQRPSDHLIGYGCKQCAVDKLKHTLKTTKEEWVKRLEAQNIIFTDEHEEITDYMHLHCTIHNFNFIGRIINYKTTCLCPICRRVSHRKQPIKKELIGSSSTLYYVYIHDIDMYKLGHTIQNVKNRFAGLDVTIIWKKNIEYETGIELEHRIHKNNSDKVYKGKIKLLKEGTYECYHYNIFPTYKEAIKGVECKDLNL